MTPCVLQVLPVMYLRGLCNPGLELDRKFTLSMDEDSADIVYFGDKYSVIRLAYTNSI